TDALLPAVVESHPAEAEPLRHGNRRFDLLRREITAVAPRTPDRLERAGRRGGQLNALPHHHALIVTQRAEVVAVMNGNERAKCPEAFAPSEFHSLCETNGERRGTPIRTLD